MQAIEFMRKIIALLPIVLFVWLMLPSDLARAETNPAAARLRPVLQAADATATPDNPTPTTIQGTASITGTIEVRITATPLPDGSIVHVVEAGQSLYWIAETYGVTVNELLELNNRRLDDRLYVGDRILVRAAPEASPTPEATNTNTPRPPTATRRPTRTATIPLPTRTPSITPSITPTPTPAPTITSDPVGNLLLGAAVVFLALGAILVGAGAVMRRTGR